MDDRMTQNIPFSVPPSSATLPIHTHTMSDSNAAPQSTISGTQSPPLEATGSHKAMGASSVHTVEQPIEVVPDKEQRKEYFGSSGHPSSDSKKEKQPKAQNLGESMADKFDKLN